MISLYEEIKKQAADVTAELCKKAKLHEGQILVVGCSSSEVCGDKIGSNSNLELLLPESASNLSAANALIMMQSCCK